MNVQPMLTAVEQIDHAIFATINEKHRTKLKQASHLIQRVLREQGVFVGVHHALTDKEAERIETTSLVISQLDTELAKANTDILLHSKLRVELVTLLELESLPKRDDNHPIFEAIERIKSDLSEARDAHDRQRDNYTELYNAVLGEGCITSECHDIVAIAKAHREKYEKFREALKSAVDILDNDFDYRPDDQAGEVYQDIKKALLP